MISPIYLLYDPITLIRNGSVITRIGEKITGWEIRKQAMELDSRIHFKLAELLAVQDKNGGAHDHQEKALENGCRDLSCLKLSPDLYFCTKMSVFRI